MIGDFNEIVLNEVKQGGRLKERPMRAFRNALKECGLTNMGFQGRWYTWERGKFASNNSYERLDRGIATES